MPFNGSGSFTLVTGNPVVTGNVISSTVQNNTMADFATGLTSCITRTGQSAALANLPMGGFKHTGAAAGASTGEYLAYGQSGANLSSLTVGTFTTTGNVNINGNVTLGDDVADTVTVNAALSAPGGITAAGGVVASGGLVITGGSVASGTYTPTLTPFSNVTAVTPDGVARWTRVGSVVRVEGVALMSPTASGTATRFYISLPFASNFGGFISGCSGVANCTGTTSPILEHTLVTGDVIGGRANVNYVALATTNTRTISYMFSYLVV